MKCGEPEQKYSTHGLRLEINEAIKAQHAELEARIEESNVVLNRVKKTKCKRIKFEEASFSSDLEKYIEQMVKTLRGTKEMLIELRPPEEAGADEEKRPAVGGAEPSSIASSVMNEYVDEGVIKK